MVKINRTFYSAINIFSTKSINIISFILAIIFLFIINLILNNSLKINSENSFYQEDSVSYEISENKIQENVIEQNEELDWYIEIPSINLKAPIAETINLQVLNKYIGHFEETATKEGNIGLAGHNRGYENNYFKNLKDVKKGEEIKYRYKDFEKTYIVDKIQIIKDTNWSYLENTKQNKITLITCIENKPDLRLCVQATEMN